MSSTDVRLAVAEEHTIYDIRAIDRAIEESAGKPNEALESLYDKMKQRGGERFLVRPGHADILDDLYERCPNFGEVIDDLKKYVALAVAGNEALNFTPILLLGEPGIGKTHFANQLAKRVGTGYEFVSMSSLTAGWVLSGASSQWHNARPGKIAHTLVHGDYANPIVVLDEVDKAGGDSRYDPMGALYALLERDTAKAFKDEFVDIDIDASHILWVTTANDERSIPEPILSRMNVYEVPRPDRDATLSIAGALYRELVSEHDWGFAPEPPAEILDCLAALPPRDMKKRLLAAFGSAKLAGRDRLERTDFEQTRGAQRRKMGF